MPSRPPATPARVHVPASPLQRAVRAAGSLLLLTTLVLGLPVALALLAGNPLPDDVPTLEAIGSALTSPDDGTLFLAVLTVLGWLGWAGFAGSVALELFARLTRRSVPRIPGLRGPQRLAAVLIAAVAMVTVSPTVTSASAAMVDAPPVAVATTPVDPASLEQVETARPGTGAAEAVVHLVQRGEGLLDLQDRYGVAWQRIAEANYGVAQADGRALQRGQTRIYPGWQLRIPVSNPGGDQREPSGPGGFGTVDVAATAPGAAAPGTGPAAGTPDPGSATGPGSPPADAAHEYEVAEGDWMWHIADRYLGDPQRYPEIAAHNPEYADRHGDFPDHIEPGWTLRLPDDAVDRGETAHATGTSTVPADGAPGEPAPAPESPPGSEPAPEPPAPPEPDAPEPPAEPPGPAPSVMTGFGAAEPDPAAVPEATGLGTAPVAAEPGTEDGDGDPDLDRLAPAALASAGLLTALVLGAAALHHHRRRQHHRAGFRFGSAAARRLERSLRTAAQPLDAARLDAALRALAGGLADRAGALPDIAGAMVDAGSVHLLLGSPCPQPPPPWRDHGDRWTLPAGTPLPPADSPHRLAPLPTLATIGSQAGIHLLLDLERLGFLTIHGDQRRALDLLRYLAAELACNTWSDAAEVLLAGFEPYEVELLTAVNPERVRVIPSVAEAVTQLRQRIGSARTTLGHTGAGDALAGRVRGLAGDAWTPQVLLVATSSPAELAALTELAGDLTGATRCAVAVATPGGAATPEQPQVAVTAEGSVHVRLEFLRASLAAAALPVPELHSLAETMRAARTTRLTPVPPAPEPDPWTVGADAAGAVRGVGRATVGTAPGPEPPTPATASLASLAVTEPVLLDGDADPSLDDDLRLWYAGQCPRPRISILGEVSVTAPGTVPSTRRRLHAELIVYLAQRAGRGADERGISSALWPDTPVADATRQLLISRARQWLGRGPTGHLWLPDVDEKLTYRLADGYLLDWHLFRRLRTRGAMRGPAGVDDLRAALELVRGVPLDGATRPAAPGTRNPYPWLGDCDIDPEQLVAGIVDTVHELAERCLAAGDPAGARWAVQQAWLADPHRSFDQPWRDLLRAEHADGQTDRLRAVLGQLMEARDAETLEDLSRETYRLVSCWPPNLLVPTG